MKTAQGAIARLLQGVKYRRLALAPTAVLAALVTAFLVAAVPDSTISARSEPATVGAVTGLIASADDQAPGVVRLTWNAAENAQVYFVLYLEEDEFRAGSYGGIRMRAFNGTEGEIAGLVGGRSYRFYATGMRWNFGNFGTVWGAWSQQATATPATGGVPSGAPVAQSEPATVGAVTGLIASADDQAPGVVRLTWNAAENAQVYFVLYLEEDDFTAGNYGGIRMRAFNGTEGEIAGLVGGRSYRFYATGMRWNFGNFGTVWGAWSQQATATPLQIPGREDLYQPIQPPMAPAFINWRWGTNQSGFRELVTDFTIHNDVGDWSDQHGLYLILLQNHISNTGFYFGLQTDANWRGKAVIFSRWETDQLADARWDEANGWYELGKHEGGFLGVRRSYEWGVGDYRIRIAPDGLESGGEWFSLWITDLATNETTWIGSLKFPMLDGTATMQPHSYATIELYGNSRIRPIDVPEWHVSVKRPSGDGVPATWGFTSYPYDDSQNALPNSDVWYDTSEDMAHLLIGGVTERSNPAVGKIDFKRILSLNDLERADRLEPAKANQLRALPWIADGIDSTERDAAQMLIDAANHYPDTFGALLQKPWVLDHDMTAAETDAIHGIRWAARHAPTVSEQILQLPWVQDNITEAEGRTIEYLYRTARGSPDLAHQMLESPWLRDDITKAESTAIEHLYLTTRYDEDIVPSLLDMPFMHTVESDDALALYAISYMGRRGENHLETFKRSRIFQNGITDDLTTLVRAAGTIRDADALARWLVPGYASIEVHMGRTELTPELKISVFRDHGDPRPETVPELVRIAEQLEGLMQVPLPNPSLVFVISDQAPSISTNGISQGKRYGFAYGLRGDRENPQRFASQYASDRPMLPSVMIHELGHDYFGNELKSWLNHTPVKTFEYAYRLDGRDPSNVPENVLNVIQRRDCEARNIQHLEEMNPPASDRGNRLCHHYLGYWMGRELLEAVGQEEYFARMRRLYHRKEELVAAGADPGIADIRELFPEHLEIVERYWSGDVGNPEEQYWGGLANLIGHQMEHTFGCCCAGCVPADA